MPWDLIKAVFDDPARAYFLDPLFPEHLNNDNYSKALLTHPTILPRDCDSQIVPNCQNPIFPARDNFGHHDVPK